MGTFVVGSSDTLGSALDRRVRAAQCTDREQDLQSKSFGVWASRTELRATVRHALGVITGYADKSLPEDDELVLSGFTSTFAITEPTRISPDQRLFLY